MPWFVAGSNLPQRNIDAWTVFGPSTSFRGRDELPALMLSGGCAMTLQFLIGAIIGSGVMLTIAREPAHRAMSVLRAKLAERRR